MKNMAIVLFLCPLSLLLFFGTPANGTYAPVAEEKTGFIGAETCKECHARQYDSYARSVHAKKSVKGPAAQDACETCHGPGAKHVEKGGGRGVEIFAFNKDVDSATKGARCLTCHERTPGMDLWDLGAHKRGDVSCANCHEVHGGGGLKPREPEVCFDCHGDVKIEANKRSHHPLLEGKIRCTSCHAPHGSLNRRMVKADDPRELCFTCHADKRGPSVWEHPPVEEDCQSCHAVHGSNHGRLLNERIPQLCQNCHDYSRHPGTPYDSTASFTSRFECLRCHSAIHGSNSPQSDGQFFVR